MTLRDLCRRDGVVTVSERSASKTVPRVNNNPAARGEIPRGRSGRPEMGAGRLGIFPLWRDQVVAAMKKHRDEFLRDHAGAPVDESAAAPLLIHGAWLPVDLR
jgi:hypothetical protein